jgi:hypothetical protein
LPLMSLSFIHCVANSTEKRHYTKLQNRTQDGSEVPTEPQNIAISPYLIASSNKTEIRIKFLRMSMIFHYTKPHLSCSWAVCTKQTMNFNFQSPSTLDFFLNLSQCYFVNHKSHMNWDMGKPGTPRREAGN